MWLGGKPEAKGFESPTGRHTSHKPLKLRKPLVSKGFASSTATNFCFVA